MGKTLDVLLGRSFKPSRFKALVNLAISRLAVLKNQKQARCSIAQSDVVQLLNLSQHDRALIRVEQVIKERNVLDVFALIEGYCVLLSERVKLIEHEKDCPDELKEAISSLIFAATRCGEFPELQEIRRVFTSRYGKEFSRRAIELRNNCGVNTKMIQKLSTRQPSLESRMKVLKEIADENGVILQLEDAPSVAAEENLSKEKENQHEPVQNQSASLDGANFGEELNNFPEEREKAEAFTDSVNRRKQYRNAADAAQEAFLSAAYAAAAARAAVELSRSSPQPPDYPNDSSNQREQVFSSNYDVSSGGDTRAVKSSGEAEGPDLGLDKVHPIDKYSLDSEGDEETTENDDRETIHLKQMDTRSYSSTPSSGEIGKVKHLPQEDRFDESDDEPKSEKINRVSNKDQWGERGAELPYYSHKQTPLSFDADLRRDYKVHSSAGVAVNSTPRLNIEKRLISVRTKR